MRLEKFSFEPLALMLILIFGSGVCYADAGCSDEASEIRQLRQRIGEQDKRIAWLERQVKALLGAKNVASSSFAGATRNSESERADGANAQGEETRGPATEAKSSSQAQAGPAKPPATSSPEIHLGGVQVSGDVYLFQYVPYGISGAHPRFELYAFSAQLEGHHGPWGFYSDYRLRTTKLRSFFPGNTWLQQGYVSYRTSLGEIRAGSFYRHVGLVWDGSFFGNLQYFDGLKLDPEFGVGFEGAHKISGRLGAEYSAQYFSSDARINGSLAGRDFVSEANARAKNDVTARFAPVWHFSDNVSLTVGGSYAHGDIERDGGPHNIRRQWAGDATLEWGGLAAYGELLNQHVDGVVSEPPQNATYSLIGVRWTRGRFQPRLNYSNGNYHGFNPRREYILQPGITIHLANGFSFLYEYDYWKQTSTPAPMLIDKSLNLILLYHF